MTDYQCGGPLCRRAAYPDGRCPARPPRLRKARLLAGNSATFLPTDPPAGTTSGQGVTASGCGGRAEPVGVAQTHRRGHTRSCSQAVLRTLRSGAGGGRGSGPSASVRPRPRNHRQHEEPGEDIATVWLACTRCWSQSDGPEVNGTRILTAFRHADSRTCRNTSASSGVGPVDHLWTRTPHSEAKLQVSDDGGAARVAVCAGQRWRTFLAVNG